MRTLLLILSAFPYAMLAMIGVTIAYREVLGSLVPAGMYTMVWAVLSITAPFLFLIVGVCINEWAYGKLKKRWNI